MSKLSQEQKVVWLNHFDTQRQSGLSQQAYCEQQSLKPHRFWYWKNKLEGSTKAYKKSKPQNKPAGHSGFVPVNVIPPPSSIGLTITLPSSLMISGIEEHNHLLAQRIIGALL